MNETIAIKDVFSTLYLYESKMTTGQLHFVDGCKKHYKHNKSLSEKQLSVLRDIKRSLSGSQTAQRYTMNLITK